MLKGTWWGVNNPIADDLSCYPNIRKMFTSNDLRDVVWINLYWDEDIDNIDLKQLEHLAGERMKS